MAVDRRPIDQMVLDVGETAFLRLAGVFEAETREAVIEMRRLMGAADWRELGRHAHSLKHATASFGLMDLAAAAQALEQAADGADAASAEAGVATLETLVESGLAEFAALLKRIAADAR